MKDFEPMMRLGSQHLENGNFEQAAAAFLAVADAYPKYDDAMHFLGLAKFRQGNPVEGERLIREAIQINPQNIRARNNLACMLRDLGRLQEASEVLQQLYLITPDDLKVCSNLAILLNDLGRPKDAIRFSTEAVALAPQIGHVHQVHGLVLKNMGELDQALSSMARAIELDPSNAESISNLSAILIEREEYEEAEKAARKALELNPDRADAHHNLGIALARQFLESEAITHLERAIALDPGNPKVYCDLAATINDLGELDRAMRLYQTALEINPDLPIARFGLGILQLTRGDFSNGWVNYEARKSAPELHIKYRKPLAPTWNGESLQDKRLLLYSEQGFGDMLQFLSFLPRLVKAGAHIDLELPPELIPLVRESQWPIEFISHTEAEYESYDYEAALMSLPLAFKLQLNDLPLEISYLKPSPIKRAYWLEKFEGRQRPRIGLCWAGSSIHKNDHNRSIASEIFSRMCQDIDADFVSLQKDAYETEREDFLSNGVQLLDWSNEFFNFGETAALASCLDLVVTVDTVIAHLAGALGIKTLTLVPYVPDWRWLEQREVSPWYPSMKLFRQPSLGDWDTVIDQLCNELGIFTSKFNS
jgi:Flp pilus assembly protein TadD/ADP-heptose:LPS heptosyltransferase